jgi:hypothetical protein
LECGDSSPPWTANSLARGESVAALSEGEINFALEGGDESLHSKSVKDEFGLLVPQPLP